MSCAHASVSCCAVSWCVCVLVVLCSLSVMQCVCRVVSSVSSVCYVFVFDFVRVSMRVSIWLSVAVPCPLSPGVSWCCVSCAVRIRLALACSEWRWKAGRCPRESDHNLEMRTTGAYSPLSCACQRQSRNRNVKICSMICSHNAKAQTRRHEVSRRCPPARVQLAPHAERDVRDGGCPIAWMIERRGQHRAGVRRC